MGESRLRIVMFPWFAMGHLTPFLDLSNKLAGNGHQIFFLVPRNTQPKLEKFNLHPQLIKFVPLIVPQIEGLPPNAETTSDLPFEIIPLLLNAMDLTRPKIESLIQEIKPHFVFLDFQHWLPSIARPLGIKCVAFLTTSPAAASYFSREGNWTVSDLIKPPPGFPSSAISLREHEARGVVFTANMEDGGSGMPLLERLTMAAVECDAICFRACREMEGPYCDFLQTKLTKPIILAGPTVPKPPASSSSLEEKWAKWLNRFTTKKVIYCALGSECRLQREQFQELLLGIELTGLPFLAALKPPLGATKVEEALPKGFKERTQERGIVDGNWIQQQHILAHPSVGCFVTHCGLGSLFEGLVISECQMVLLPQMFDQSINARLMGGDLRVGIEIEKGNEDGLFTKESVLEAISLAMDEESGIGKEVKANHAKWREFLLTQELEKTYINDFLHKLRRL